MPAKTYQVYPYRWVVLGVFSLINLTIQMLWICFAPITGPAAKFYGVSDLQIGFLAMSFMIVYLPLSIPISWAIDTLGYRKAVSIGAVLMGVFGILRGVFASNYTWVLVSTLGIAVAQPFLLNAISTVAARWFPLGERATASGLVLVANFIGVAIGQVTAPLLILSCTGIPAMLLIFGGITAASSVVFLLFTRDAPPTPPCPPDQVGRALMLDGLKSMLKMKDVWLLLVLFLIGMGVFNGVSTWIEDIVRPRGFTITQAGNLGAFLLVGGIAGAALIPILSDRLHKRKVFLLVGIILAVPGLVGLTFATVLWAGGGLHAGSGLLPDEPGPHRLPVRRRDHLPRPRRHLQRPAQPGRAGFGRLHLRHGSLQERRRQLHLLAGDPGGPAGRRQLPGRRPIRIRVGEKPGRE